MQQVKSDFFAGNSRQVKYSFNETIIAYALVGFTIVIVKPLFAQIPDTIIKWSIRDCFKCDQKFAANCI